MNLLLLHQHDHWLDQDTVVIRDQRAEHIRSVLRASPGQTLRVGRVDGLKGTGTIEAMDANGVVLQVSLSEPALPRHRFDIVLALPRPKMLRRILRTVAEFGVANLHLINTARVERSFWQTPLLQPSKLSEALQAGMERACDTVQPQVHLHKRFRPFVEDQLPGLCGERSCWITEMGASMALSETPPHQAMVMIGPEGGFVPFEIDLATSVIAQPVHLGERILSVDTALTTALAQGLPVH